MPHTRQLFATTYQCTFLEQQVSETAWLVREAILCSWIPSQIEEWHCQALAFIEQQLTRLQAQAGERLHWRSQPFQEVLGVAGARPGRRSRKAGFGGIPAMQCRLIGYQAAIFIVFWGIAYLPVLQNAARGLGPGCWYQHQEHLCDNPGPRNCLALG